MFYLCFMPKYMNDSMYMYDPSMFALKFVFLEIFQKPHGGLFIASRRLMIILVFFGF